MLSHVERIFRNIPLLCAMYFKMIYMSTKVSPSSLLRQPLSSWISQMGHSRTYQPKLHHYVTNRGDFWLRDDIYYENLKSKILFCPPDYESSRVGVGWRMFPPFLSTTEFTILSRTIGLQGWMSYVVYRMSYSRVRLKLPKRGKL